MSFSSVPSKTRVLVAVGILAWAGALQGHMWYLQSTEEFKRKFPELSEIADEKSPSLTVRLKGPPQGNKE